MGVAIKRFLSNKNTVTIIGVILGIVVLYIGYTWRVNNALELVSVPVAKEEIASRTKITEDMLTYIKLPRNSIESLDNLETSASTIVGKYVSFGTSVAKNSMFYTSYLISKSEMPDSAFANIPDGYTIFSLDVTQHSTYGNSIYPDNYIDLNLKATDDSGKVIFGKLISSIKVLAVKDSNGNHVFETTVETRTPAELLFAVTDDMFLLLKKAEYIGCEISPVPRNASYSADPGETSVANDYLRDFILSKAATIPDSEITTTEDSVSKEDENTTETTSSKNTSNTKKASSSE